MLRIFATVILLAMTALAVSMSADAQQRATLSAARADNDTRFTAEFQQAMETGNYGQAAQLASSGNATHGSAQATGRRTHAPIRATSSSASPSASTRLAVDAPPPDEAEYTCNGGNCACAGASDCVAMAPICEEGTIGCNDYGCTCHEAD